ncbi:MAG: lysophospholipid acyltransferase family protein [candidate division WOR-3 bacterium]
MKRARNFAITWLMPLGTLLQFMLPRWLVTKIAIFIGGLACRLNPRKREKLIENYRHILGRQRSQAELTQIACQAFKNLALFYADLLRVPVMKKKIVLLGTFDPRNINRVLKQNRSAILVTAHIGNWDLAGVFLTALGYPLSAVVEPIPGGWTKTFDRYRRACAMETIPIPEHNRINRAIERGKIVALVADRDLTGHGILCPAFDAYRFFPKGPAVYALRHRIPVVIGYFIYQKRKNLPPYIGVIEPPIEFQPTANMDEDIHRLTSIIASKLNQIISSYPDQWLVFNADWKCGK